MPVHVVGATPHELVALKPAGLACELPRDPAADSLIRRLEAEGYDDLRLVHRLDAPACGLVLVARSKAAAAHYAREIEARRWQKFYVARVAAPRARVAGIVGSHRAYLKTVGLSARVVRSGGKASFLEVVTTSDAPHVPGASHVLLQLHTGRFHQIRAMLAHLGVPLSGDVLYGGPGGRVFYLEHVVLACHAYESGAWTHWQAPPHPDRDHWAPEMAGAVVKTVARVEQLAARTALPPRDRGR